MTRPDLARAWWPVARLSPIDALREVLAALEEGRPASAAAARHVAAGLRLFLQGQRDITRNLGLRTRRGGRHDTDQAREIADTRNGLIRAGAKLVGGHTTKEQVAALQGLMAVPVGQIDDEQLRFVLGKLHDEHEGQIPTSLRQLERIVGGP